MKKTAIIVGITGQDGAYLAENLLDKGYEIIGVYRATTNNFWRLNELNIMDKVHMKDIESFNFERYLSNHNVSEVYNLYGQSSVAQSFSTPQQTIMTNGVLVLEILESIRKSNQPTKYYQASSSEIFGNSPSFAKDESSRLHPRSPYAVSKMFAHWTVVNYREVYNVFACNGILFNHESPLRGKNFVTRKITQSVAEISLGIRDCFDIGNLNSQRDWGHARDFIEGMWSMMQHPIADDYVLATGTLHSVREFLEMSFKAVNIDIVWRGKGLNEKGYCKQTNKVLVNVNSKYFRPVELEHSLGSPIKALNVLGWKSKTKLHELCAEMIEADLYRLHSAISFKPQSYKYG